MVLLICFAGIYFNLAHWGSVKGTKQLLIASALTFSALLVGLTELLGLAHRLNFTGVFTGWALIALLFMLCLYFNRAPVGQLCLQLWGTLKQKLTNFGTSQKVLLGAAVVLLLLMLGQGLLYPPNNWDAMTYHMARISSWVSHGTVAHYPTHITRQLYQPPFAEYVIMHFGLLTGTDLFANLVQYIFYLLTLVSILLLLDDLGLGRPYYIIAIVLAVTIPEVVLQATSTQNDIVTAFFVVTAFMLVIKSMEQPSAINFMLIGLATGLGILTKGTAYIYLAPILLLLGIVVAAKLLKHRQYQPIGLAGLAGGLALLLNAGHFGRNYQLAHNILGVDAAESAAYSNQKMNARLLVSSLIKNAGLHMAVMYAKPVAATAQKAIVALHRKAGIDINDPANNYHHLPFTIGGFITDEEGSANPFHLILIVVSISVAVVGSFKNRSNWIATALTTVFMVQLVLFCFYLKWQPWHSRLHVPLFLIAVPLICYAFSMAPRLRRGFYWLSPVLLVYALLVILHTERRPYTADLFLPRYQKYYLGNNGIYHEYNAIVQNIRKAHYKNIGLILGEDSWQYPLFTNSFSQPLNPIHINVSNYSKAAPADTARVNCIISTTVNKPILLYNGITYINKTTGNKLVWLYK